TSSSSSEKARRYSLPGSVCRATPSSSATTTTCSSSTCAERSATPSPRWKPAAISWWRRAPRRAATPGPSPRCRSCARTPTPRETVDAGGARVPVVAAGGLFDGRGLAASLALGADGVWIGTRFIATPEARSTPGYKEALLRTAEDGTVISRAFTGKTLRAVRNKTTQYYDDHPREVRPFPEQIMKAVEEGTLHLTGGGEAAGVAPDRECSPAGQGTGAIQEVVPAGELVRRFVAEAEAVIESLGGLRTQAPA